LALELTDTRNVRSVILRAGRNDDRTRRERGPVIQQNLVGMPLAPKPHYLTRDDHLRTELLRLVDGTRGKLLSGYAHRKPKVVLYLRAGTGLAARSLGLDKQRLEALRSGIDSGGQARWARAHDHRVIDDVGIDRPAIYSDGTTFVDTMVIPYTSQHQDWAEKWINYIYDRANYAKLVAFVQYIPVLSDMTDELTKLDPELAKNPLINPPADMLAKAKGWPALTDEQLQKFNTAYAAVTGA